jgi:hypothetical protein
MEVLINPMGQGITISRKIKLLLLLSFYLLIIISLGGCGSKSNSLLFECYSNNDLLYSFTDEDIEFVDWENQIYKFKKEFATEKLANGNMWAGTRKEIIKLKLNNKVILILRIYNPHSSNVYAGEYDGVLDVYKSTRKIVTKNGFFNISMKSDRKDKLFSSKLFSFWKTKNKLKCLERECENFPSDNIEDNIEKQFSEELER